MVGDQWPVAVALAGANALECGLAIIILSRATKGAGRIRSFTHLRGLVLAGLTASTVAGMVSAGALALSDQVGYATAWGQWFAAHALAIPIYTPLALILIDGLVNRKPLTRAALLEWSLVIAATLLLAIIIFGQSTYPFLFLAAGLVILAAFRTGLAGAAFVVAVLAIAATVATQHDVGPIALVYGLRQQMIALQLFVATCAAIGLPVAVALRNREKLGAELRESRDFLGAIVDGVSEVIFRIDDEWRWTYLNQAWSKLTGTAAHEWLGEPAFAKVHFEDREKVTALKQTVATGRCEARAEIRLELTAANWRILDLAVKPHFDSDGRFAGAIGNFSDITRSHPSISSGSIRSIPG